MAYVGTPTFQNSPQYTLASILQGEAGGEGVIGMQAVGGVIQNRAAAGTFGSGLLGVALAPNQFQGQAVPGSDAMAIAGQMLNGGIEDPTGGALYYANPANSTASWATNLNSSNSYQIGNHFFTDNQQGIPFAGPNAVTSTSGDYLTGAGTPSNYGDITGYQVAGVNAPLGSYGDALGPNGADVAPDITNDPTIIGDQSTNPDFGAGSSGVPDTGTFDWSTLENANNPVQSQIPIQPQSSQGQYVQPIGGAEWISNASDIGQVAGQNISTAADTLSKQLGSSTTTLAQTAGTVESSSFSGITDFLVRGGFIAVGLVVLIGAFAFYFVENKPNIVRAMT